MSGIGSSTNQSRYAVFHAATNIYALDYRRFSAVADQMEPFAELLLKRIQEQSQETQTAEYADLEAQFSHFKDDVQHTGTLCSVLGDLAFAFETLLPISNEPDAEIQAKIEKMKKGKTGILVLKAEVEVLSGKMEEGCLKISKLMQRLQLKFEGWETVEGDEEDLVSKERSAPQFFTFSSQSSSSSSFSTSHSSSMSPSYSLAGDVTDDIRNTLLDTFDIEAWKKEVEELRQLEEQSGEINFLTFTPESTPREIALQESHTPLLESLSETIPSFAERQPDLTQVDERVQTLLTNVNLLMQRDAHLQKNHPIQKKTRTPPHLSFRSISAPVSSAPSRRSSLNLSILKPSNQQIERLLSPNEDEDLFSEVVTAKKDEEPSPTIQDTVEMSDRTSSSNLPASTPIPGCSELPQPIKTNESNETVPSNLTTQHPLSFIADVPIPLHSTSTPQSPKKLYPPVRQQKIDDNKPKIVERFEVEGSETPLRLTTKIKVDRSCSYSFVEWCKSCFAPRRPEERKNTKVTNLDVHS